MEMDDHHHQYGLSDLRQLINGRPSMHFQPIPQVSELFPGHRNLLPQPHHHFEMMQMVGTRQMSDLLPLGLHEIPVESSANAATATVAVTSASTPSSVNGFDGEVGGFGGDPGTGRWPRQETLTLLEIRSRLDPKFKEANQKGPLWDEVSRIMSDEHGYQRSGKKCREKFENLYKYYKKTKEGKAGRQDGKHYRFFRQLEALYGDTSSSVPIPESDHLIGKSFGRFHGNPNSNSSTQEGYHSQKLCDSLSLSNNSSDFHTSCSDDNDLSTAAGVENDSRKRRRSGRSWKVKIKEFIDVQMRKLMERQEAWLDRLTKTLEHKERERMLREEEWRKQEAERIDKEHKFWAKEREWIEARDAALMEALQTLSGRQIKAASPEELMVGEVQNHSENQNENGSEIMNNSGKEDGWGEAEITRLIQVRSSMKSRFDQGGGCPEEILWEEIASKLACLGYEKSGSMCKEKWDEINNFLRKKKSKENSISGPYYSNNESIYNPPGGYCEINGQGGNSPPNSNIGNAASDSCFRYLMGDGENLWENYGLKLNKGENQ